MQCRVIVASERRATVFPPRLAQPLPSPRRRAPSHTLTHPLSTPRTDSYGEYSQFHFTHPYKPIMGGESASCTSDRGYYLPTNATEGHMNSDDDGCVVSAWASAAQNPWDSGNFVWTGHE